MEKDVLSQTVFDNVLSVRPVVSVETESNRIHSLRLVETCVDTEVVVRITRERRAKVIAIDQLRDVGRQEVRKKRQLWNLRRIHSLAPQLFEDAGRCIPIH